MQNMIWSVTPFPTIPREALAVVISLILIAFMMGRMKRGSRALLCRASLSTSHGISR